MGARRRVVYAAPSVSLEVSSALINASERLGAGNVAIVLDVSEDVFRLGYGVIDALNLLHERNISVRHSEGLRISLVIIDDEGFIFCQPALLVDAARRGDDQPNAVRASFEQIEGLMSAVIPPPTQRTLPLDGTDTQPSSQTGQDALPALDQAEIGQKLAPAAQIEKIERAIQANPVDNFDLTRVVKVFAAYIQFCTRCQRSAQTASLSWPGA
jgi:hypothetical protein